MKKLKVLLLLSLVFTACSFRTDKPDELKWLSWNEGYPLALKKNKIAVVDIYTDWCGWCKRMDKDTYSKQNVIDEMQKNFVAIKLNPEDNSTPYLLDSLKLQGAQLMSMLTGGAGSGYPTIVFIYPKDKKVTYQPGYQTAEQFLETLSKVKAAKSN